MAETVALRSIWNAVAPAQLNVRRLRDVAWMVLASNNNRNWLSAEKPEDTQKPEVAQRLEELVAPADVQASIEIPEGALTMPEHPGEEPQVCKAMTCHRDSATVTYVRPGVRLQPDSVPFPRRNNFWEELLAVGLMITLFCSGLLSFPSAPLILYWACKLGYMYCQTLIAIFLLLAFMPDSSISLWFRHHYIFDCVRRHYRLRCITPPLPYTKPEKKYLLAQFPHGVFPLAVWLNAATVGLPASGFPRPMRAAVADVLLTLPYVKHLFQLMGCVSADKSVVVPMLKRESLGIIPEGIAGITQGATPTREQIYILQRKGFVRAAIQAGADIVPIYHLGNSQLYSFYGFDHLSRTLRCAVGYFYGRWGLPIPRQYDIVSLVGMPVEVVQCDEPAAEYVDEIHAKVVKTLVDNFETHKHLLPGWEKKTLTLV